MKQKWEAFDGKSFDKEEDCEKYEEALEATKQLSDWINCYQTIYDSIDFVDVVQQIIKEGQLNKLNNGSFDAYIITDKDFILGYTDDLINFKPIQMDYSYILPETQNTGSGAIWQCH